MKSGQHRDEIVKREKVIGFEMEGAGVWDNISCLIIKGVCDYADSHKNKAWQVYAAATGAATAKAFLEYWVPSVKEKPPVFRNIPFARNVRFIGREEQLYRLEKAVFSELPPSKIAITGLGGIGKTQIALELAYRVKEKTPDCSILWIPAMSAESIQEAYNEIAQNIGLYLPGEKGVDVRKLVRQHFSSESAGRWIMVFDSADDRNVWNKLRTKDGESRSLTDWLPRSEKGCIIFTSRTSELASHLAPQRIAENILEMRDDIAVELLRSLIHDNNPSKTDLQLLAKELTYLPLALVQAAAYMAQKKTSPATYLKLLQTQEKHLVSLLSKEFEDDGRYCTAKNPVMATWLISFDEIKKSNPLATEYLSFMSCVEHRHIPEDLLPQRDPLARNDAIGTLKGYAFVNEHLEGSFLSLHRLVHLAARSWLRAENQLSARTVYTCERLNEVLATPSARDRSRWRAYLSHAQYLLDSDMMSYRNISKRVLRWKLAICLHEDARYLEAESFLLDELRSMDQDPSSNVVNVSHLKKVLARNFVYQGKFDEAEEAYKELVILATESHDQSNRDVLDASINLATLYAQTSRWKEAESQYLTLKRNHERELDSETLCRIDSNLARLYLEQGKWNASATLFSDVFERRKRQFGTKDLSTLITQAGHATARLYLGHYEEALKDFNQIEKTMREDVGESHRLTLDVMAKVALAYKFTGQLNNAKQRVMQVIELASRGLGKDNPATLSYRNTLAQVYLDLGQFSKAEQVIKDILSAVECENDKDTPEILSYKAVLASSYRAQGKLEAAEKVGRFVLEARKRVLGTEHPDTFTSVSQLGVVLVDRGNYKKAEAMHQQALRGHEKVLGPKHPDTLTSMHNLAFALKQLGKFSDASSLLKKCADHRNQVLGSHHPQAISSTTALRAWEAAQSQSSKRQQPCALSDNSPSGPTSGQASNDDHTDSAFKPVGRKRRAFKNFFRRR
ncbi:hypothetical protein BJX68DRAFT_42947 [Aspergillus pseudodeflectus]|uniref:NB-ARC domain-containing protein n=1 Tax=Aspergillus pseudodeflectus TaxID=176178 RepID=A0ABR4J7K8_9EURO